MSLAARSEQFQEGKSLNRGVFIKGGPLCIYTLQLCAWGLYYTCCRFSRLVNCDVPFDLPWPLLLQVLKHQELAFLIAGNNDAVFLHPHQRQQQQRSVSLSTAHTERQFREHRFQSAPERKQYPVVRRYERSSSTAYTRVSRRIQGQRETGVRLSFPASQSINWGGRDKTCL